MKFEEFRPKKAKKIKKQSEVAVFYDNFALFRLCLNEAAPFLRIEIDVVNYVISLQEQPYTKRRRLPEFQKSSDSLQQER